MDSETINLARLAPSVGLSLDSGGGLIQSVMAGADLMRDMGKGSEYDHEFTLWYSLGLSWDDCIFTGHAGMFPRRFSAFGSESVPPRGTCRVPTVFMSDKVRVYDSNMEGLLLRSTHNIGNVELVQKAREEGSSGYNLRKLLGLWVDGLTTFSIKPRVISASFGVWR